jgi:hypothetical protein
MEVAAVMEGVVGFTVAEAGFMAAAFTAAASAAPELALLDSASV